MSRRKSGINARVPQELFIEVDIIKQTEGIKTTADGIRRLVDYAILGRTASRKKGGK